MTTLSGEPAFAEQQLFKHVRYYMEEYRRFLRRFAHEWDDQWAGFMETFRFLDVFPSGTRDFTKGPAPVDLIGPFVEYARALLQVKAAEAANKPADDRIIDVISQILPSAGFMFSDKHLMNLRIPSMLDPSLCEEHVGVLIAYCPFGQMPSEMAEQPGFGRLALDGKWEETIHLAWQEVSRHDPRASQHGEFHPFQFTLRKPHSREYLERVLKDKLASVGVARTSSVETANETSSGLSIRELIDRSCRAKGWNIDKLAEKAEVSRRTVINLRNGTRPRSATLEAVSNVLNISIEEMERARERSPKPKSRLKAKRSVRH